MLHPSYSELIDVLNSDSDNDNQVTSRYTIVIAAAKRARQLVDGAVKQTKYSGNDKAVSIAVNEMSEGMIRVKMNAQAQQENREQNAGAQVFEKNAEEKKLMSLNFDNFDDDELDDYDDFEDELETEAVADLELDIAAVEEIDDVLDDDSFEDDSYEEDSFDEDTYKEDDIYDDEDIDSYDD